MNNYNNAFAEAFVILNLLNEEEYNKIPSEMLNVISSNMNKEYYYEIQDDFNLDSNMLVETKAILFNIFRDYLCTEEQKKKIIEMQKEERIENEIKKGQKFSNDVFARKDKIVENNVNTELVEIKKESISIKIWNFIKQILRKIKRK